MSFSRGAKLVLTLVDRVSGPASIISKSLHGVVGATRALGTLAMTPAGMLGAGARSLRTNVSNMTAASGALTLGLGVAAKSVYEMENILNEIEGRRFGKEDIFGLADGTEMTRKAFRERVNALIQEVNKESPRNAVEVAKAYNQLVQAGLSHEQTEGILPIAVDFAIAGNYDTEEAADKLTNVMTAMRMGMSTYAEAHASALRTSDVIAYAANMTNSNVEQMTEAFKYAAPSASALGVSIEQLAAMFLIQAKRGIKASEAGVSIRAMLTRMVRPTKMANEALARYNIDLTDYLEKSQAISASDFTKTFSFRGVDLAGSEGAIQKILDAPGKTGEKVKQLTKVIMGAVGDSTTMSAEQISDGVGEILFGFGESLDVERLIADMQAAGIAMSDFFKIFDVRQGARTLALFGDDFSKWTRNLEENADGFSQALRLTRMQGIVGAVSRLDASLVDLFRAAADSGVLDAVTDVIERMAKAMVDLSKANPELLRMGTYAAIALASLAPLGFILSGAATAAALLVNPLAWIAASLGYIAYLKWDQISKYVGDFGSSLKENLGPSTLRLMERAAAAMKGLGQSAMDGIDSTSTKGGEHGSYWAQRIEAEAAYIEDGIQDIKDLGTAIVDAWHSFEAGWDALVQGTHRKVGEWGQAIKDGAKWMSDGSMDQWLADSMTRMVAAGSAGLTSAYNAFMATQFAADMAGAGSAIYQAGAGIITSLWDGAVAKFNEFAAWLSGIPGRVRAAIGNIDLSNIIKWPSLPTWLGGGGSKAPAGGSMAGGSSAPPIAGRRAYGGPVKAGLTYEVGERGRELFTPDRNGRILSNQQSSGALGGGKGTTVVFHNSFQIVGGGDKAEQIARDLDRQLNRAAQIAFGSGNAYGEV